MRCDKSSISHLRCDLGSQHLFDHPRCQQGRLTDWSASIEEASAPAVPELSSKIQHCQQGHDTKSISQNSRMSAPQYSPLSLPLPIKSPSNAFQRSSEAYPRPFCLHSSPSPREVFQTLYNRYKHSQDVSWSLVASLRPFVPCRRINHTRSFPRTESFFFSSSSQARQPPTLPTRHRYR